MLDWILSLLMWLLISIGAWLYALIGYRWGKKSQKVLDNWDTSSWPSRFVCFSCATILSSEKPDPSFFIMTEDSGYLFFMVFFWPFKIVWFLVSFPFCLIYVLYKKVATTTVVIAIEDSFFWLLVKVKKIIFLEDIGLFKDIGAWHKRWQEKRAERKQKIEDELKARAEAHPLQDKIDRLAELRQEIISKQQELNKIEAEIELEGFPFR